MYIEWDDCYSVSVPLFDEQHKILFGMMNTLQIGMMEGRSKELIADVLEGLFWYTKVHFRLEEMDMIRCGYPKFDEPGRSTRRCWTG